MSLFFFTNSVRLSLIGVLTLKVIIDIIVLKSTIVLFVCVCLWNYLFILLDTDAKTLCVVKRTSASLKQESVSVGCVPLLGWKLVNARYGSLCSVEWQDVRHPAAVMVFWSWGFKSVNFPLSTFSSSYLAASCTVCETYHCS